MRTWPRYGIRAPDRGGDRLGEQCGTYARESGNRPEPAHALLTRAALSSADGPELGAAIDTFRPVGDPPPREVGGQRRLDGTVASVEVPEVVRNLARAAGADAWLAGLPDLLARLREEWSLTVEAPYEDATEAYVAAATLADGTPAVLKVLVQRPGGTHTAEELTVLRLAAGEGCVALLKHDDASGAMLLERLGPSMYRLGVPFEQRLEILTRVARRLWRPGPGVDLPSGADRSRTLVAYVETQWDALGRPCSEAAVEQALAAGARRIARHDDERAVLVHGDVHQWNTLRAGDDWKLVDPDGLLAEPEFDLGVLMREDPLELMTGDPRDRSRLLATRTGLDETAIWEWGLINRMQNGLSCLVVGLEPYGTHCLAAADRIASLAG